jgi:hypothetical protein
MVTEKILIHAQFLIFSFSQISSTFLRLKRDFPGEAGYLRFDFSSNFAIILHGSSFWFQEFPRDFTLKPFYHRGFFQMIPNRAKGMDVDLFIMGFSSGSAHLFHDEIIAFQG